MEDKDNNGHVIYRRDTGGKMMDEEFHFTGIILHPGHSEERQKTTMIISVTIVVAALALLPTFDVQPLIVILITVIVVVFLLPLFIVPKMLRFL